MSLRIKCVVQYDGSRYHGFQKQINSRTVQKEIEAVLTKIHKYPIVIHASGRTDAFVHALGQVFHFITKLDISEENWKMAINCMLPRDIYIKKVEIVTGEFHSRYNTKVKEYRYYISQDEYNPLRSQYVCFQRDPLNLEKINEAIKLFIGTHDFTSFSSGKVEKDRVRTIYEAYMNVCGKEIEFIFKGNGFLRYQIRIMMGTLIEIGKGKREVNSINQLFVLKDRTKASFTAEPQALYLYSVEY